MHIQFQLVQQCIQISTRINSSSVHMYIFVCSTLRVILQGFVDPKCNTTHGNNDVSCIMDMAEAIINYHYITSKETVLREKSNEKQDVRNITCDCRLRCTSTSDSEQEEEEEGHFEPDSGARRNSC